jgi:hypothetical protein
MNTKEKDNNTACHDRTIDPRDHTQDNPNKDSLLGKHKDSSHGPYIKLKLRDKGYLGILGLTGFRVMALANPSCKSTDNRSFAEFQQVSIPNIMAKEEEGVQCIQYSQCQ